MARDLFTTALTQTRLDAHFAHLLGCEAALLRRSEVTILADERRRTPNWSGWTLPLYGVAPIGGTGCVLACLPDLVPALRHGLAALPPGTVPFDTAWVAAVRQVATSIPDAEWSWRRVYVTDQAGFRPHGVDPSVRVERWEPGEHPTSWLSRSFDGPCFVIHDPAGGLASWAGTRQTSDLAWEIVAVTEPPYRGRGLATVLAAAASAEVLARGRLALWLADIDNVPSQRLVERLGFQVYGEQVASALFAPHPAAASPLVGF